ncbi:oligosaccharide flippase family protein [Vagococcus fluvialis]|uniref:lipopolysaccharide biosynthesis protein n=1 Tax=Vagococcus fluvialis TaxID=2738 RepID=UPI0032E410D9
MNQRLKKLFNNSIIFAIGNLGSRVISIVMVPFYTYVLTSKQYGEVDLYLTIISLLLPIATLSVPEAVLRFVMDEEQDEGEVFYNSSMLMSIGFGFLFFFFIFLSIFFSIPKELLFILLVQGIQVLLSQYIRGIGLVKEYAINGILMSFLLAIFNVLFMYIFSLGVNGYLFSIIFTNIISIFYFGRYLELPNLLKNKKFSKNLSKEIIKFSVPLIPNSVMWWVLNASSRFFILSLLGISANGIFAVANKIPTVLIIFQSIFFQAWQLSAIEESNSSDSNKYTSKVYNFFSSFMVLMTILLIIFSKFVILNFINPTYAEAWKYVPFLLLGVLYSSFSSFVGTQYIVLKKTSAILYSTLIGATTNVLFCYILIPIIGLQGASVSLFLGFFVVYIYRLININKVSSFKFSLKIEVINLLLLLLATQWIKFDSILYLFIGFITIIIIFLLINKKIIVFFIDLFKLLKIK